LLLRLSAIKEWRTPWRSHHAMSCVPRCFLHYGDTEKWMANSALDNGHKMNLCTRVMNFSWKISQVHFGWHKPLKCATEANGHCHTSDNRHCHI
jgi:hypothetical protein